MWELHSFVLLAQELESIARERVRPVLLFLPTRLKMAKKQGKRRKRTSQQKEPGRIPEFKKETQNPLFERRAKALSLWSQGLAIAPLTDRVHLRLS